MFFGSCLINVVGQKNSKKYFENIKFLTILCITIKKCDLAFFFDTNYIGEKFSEMF